LQVDLFFCGFMVIRWGYPVWSLCAALLLLYMR
jgi:hypothetical protein